MFHHLLPTHLVLPIIYYLDCVFQAFRYASKKKAEKTQMDRTLLHNSFWRSVNFGREFTLNINHLFFVFFFCIEPAKLSVIFDWLERKIRYTKLFESESMGREVRRIDMEISLFAYPFDLDSPPAGDPKLCEWHDFSLSIPTTTTPGYQKWPAIINWEIASLFWLFQATWIWILWLQNEIK